MEGKERKRRSVSSMFDRLLLHSNSLSSITCCDHGALRARMAPFAFRLYGWAGDHDVNKWRVWISDYDQP